MPFRLAFVGFTVHSTPCQVGCRCVFVLESPTLTYFKISWRGKLLKHYFAKVFIIHVQMGPSDQGLSWSDRWSTCSSAAPIGGETKKKKYIYIRISVNASCCFFLQGPKNGGFLCSVDSKSIKIHCDTSRLV